MYIRISYSIIYVYILSTSFPLIFHTLVPLVKFEVLTAVNMKSAVFWVATLMMESAGSSETVVLHGIISMILFVADNHMLSQPMKIWELA